MEFETILLILILILGTIFLNKEVIKGDWFNPKDRDVRQ